MRAIMVAVSAGLLALCVAAAAPAFDRSQGLADCPTLEACMAVLDHAPRNPAAGSMANDEQAIAAALHRFGDPAKQELLRRAAGPDPYWNNFAGAILTYWPEFSAADVPMLIAALKRRPGGWVARPLGRIATPQATEALVQDVWANGSANQSGFALETFGIKSLPFLMPMLGDDEHWNDAAFILRNIRTQLTGMAPDWASQARDASAPAPLRLAALRALTILGPLAQAQGPGLRPLLHDPKRRIRKQAAETLLALHDVSVLAGIVENCRGTRYGAFDSESFRDCQMQIASYGDAARRYGPIMRARFLDSKNGYERATGASLLGVIGYAPAIPRLIARLHDPDWRVVYAAARSLGWLRAKDAAPALLRVEADHWLADVRAMAAAARKALAPGAAPLAKPSPQIFDAATSLTVDATAVPDAEPCKSGHWRYGDSVFAEPDASPLAASSPALGAGVLSGQDHGEFGGGLYWSQGGAKRVTVAVGNVAGIAPSSLGAVAAFGEAGIFRQYGATADAVAISNGPSGYGYVLSVTRSAHGSWRLREIARLPRAADAIAAIGPDLYAAWSGNRAVVFTPGGIQGLAVCMP